MAHQHGSGREELAETVTLLSTCVKGHQPAAKDAMISILEFLAIAPRHLFFTGKGGVGKTSLACASAVRLASGGRRVLLVSTDPASNLDAVLGTTLENKPTLVAGAPNLQAMNIDPEQAAREYRERTVGPYRSTMPAQELKMLEERLGRLYS